MARNCGLRKTLCPGPIVPLGCPLLSAECPTNFDLIRLVETLVQTEKPAPPTQPRPDRHTENA